MMVTFSFCSKDPTNTSDYVSDAPVHRGVRVGTANLTTRSVPEEKFKTVASFLHRAIQLTLAVQTEAGPKLEDFYEVVTNKGCQNAAAIDQLKKDIGVFARSFPIPGVDVNALKKPEGVED
jgi:glycine hydroxymethyltransferase